MDGCIFSKGISRSFFTRIPSSASVDGDIARPAGPRQRLSRYLAIPSCSQMGTVFRLFWEMTRCVYSWASVSIHG